MIFLTGIYGSGKTELCKFLSSELKIHWLRASDLIYATLKSSPPKDKRISNICSNQQALLKALYSLPPNQRPHILEGHLCLLDNYGRVKHIPQNVFKRLQLSGLIFLQVNEKTAQQRLWKRDHVRYSIEQLNLLQQQEKAYALKLSHKLSIPLIFVHDGQNCERQILIENLKKILDHPIDI